jgi:hypothetical protein
LQSGLPKFAEAIGRRCQSIPTDRGRASQAVPLAPQGKKLHRFATVLI